MDPPLQFEQQLFISDIKSIDINHIRGLFFPHYQSLSLYGTLKSHLTLKHDKMEIKLECFVKDTMNLYLFKKKSLLDVILNTSFIKHRWRFSKCSCDIQMKEKMVFYCPDNFHEHRISLLQNENVQYSTFQQIQHLIWIEI